MNKENGASSRIKEVGKDLKDWKLTVSLLIAVIGLGASASGIVEAINSTYASEYASLYDYKKEAEAQSAVDLFNKDNERLISEGETRLDVSDNVRQAVDYRTSLKTAFAKGKEANDKSAAKFMGGLSALAIFGGVAGGLLSRKHTHESSKSSL